ncbi:MAG: ATP-binding protein [Candidatus Rokubacteria bacterium]|nr:ATP-binding protein [Candidatus Rokubacteria bacterium]
MHFVNREKELQTLRETQQRAERQSQFTLVLGRRRIGKTTLVREFLRSVPRALYFFVTRKRGEDLRAEFAEILAAHQPAFRGARLTWDGLIRACFDTARDASLTVVFDEFQNFRYVDPSVFSILQKHWDTLHDERKIHLIAVGSLVSLMERIFAGAREPLARRATGYLRVHPFDSGVIAALLRKSGRRGFRELIRHWTIFGGCPKYYALAGDADLLGKDPLALIDTLILRQDAPLREEGKALLVEEFGREHTTAFSILRAIASGRVQLREIADVTGMPVTALPKELHRLQEEFGLVEREIPLGDRTGRLGRYRLQDSFLAFWFRYVYSFQSQLEAGRRDKVLALIRRDLPTLEGQVFETLIRQRLAQGDPTLKFPFDPDAVGRWWDRQGTEIDVVARTRTGTEAFIGECRLSADKVDRALLHGLLAKTEQVPWRQAARRVHSGVFTVGRVSPTIRDEARALNIALWEL